MQLETTTRTANRGAYVRVAGRTDRGRVRANNEDAFVVADLTGGERFTEVGSSQRFYVRERGLLLAVSDGMGGAAAGEVASALVIESVTRAMRAKPVGADADVRLMEAVEKAHRTVWTQAHRDGIRMGATLTAVYIDGTTAYVAEVGDSRAYLIRRGAMTLLTKDQSFVQVLIDGGVLKAEEALHSTYRNVILQAMGHQPNVSVALGKIELKNRDCLLLCSDGLTNELSEDEIRDVVLGASDLAGACDQLIAVANERGGKDNITAVLGGVGGSLAPPGQGDDVDANFEVIRSFERKCE